MKKLLTLLLAVLMIVSMTACAQKSDEEMILGTWTAGIDVSKMMIDGIIGSDEDLSPYFSFKNVKDVDFTLEFKEDGTVSAGVDAAKFADSFVPALADGIRKYLKANGLKEYVTQYTSDDNLLEFMGFDRQGLIDQLNTDAGLNDMSYELKDGRLYIDGVAFDYRLTNNKLSITNTDGSSILGTDLGISDIVFKK